MRIEVKKIQFEWNSTSEPTRGYPRLNAAKCWNNPFWYGDGSPATEPSVILRESDYKKLRRLARLAPSKGSAP